MGEYLYKCGVCGGEQTYEHSMFAAPIYLCCGATMLRIPLAPMVNWNGNKPSSGELSPYIKEHIDNAPKRRDEIAERKEQS